MTQNKLSVKKIPQKDFKKLSLKKESSQMFK